MDWNGYRGREDPSLATQPMWCSFFTPMEVGGHLWIPCKRWMMCQKTYNNVRRSMNHGFTSSHISWKYASFHIQSKGGEKNKVQTLASRWKNNMTISSFSLRAITSCNSKLPCVNQGLIYSTLETTHSNISFPRKESQLQPICLFRTQTYKHIASVSCTSNFTKDIHAVMSLAMPDIFEMNP